MKSIISKYALEQKIGGAPSGHFYLSKDGMRSIAQEVVATHLGFKGKKGEKYLNEKFPEAWDRFDVNKEGKFEASRGPMFCRYLVPDVIQGFGLQLNAAPKK